MHRLLLPFTLVAAGFGLIVPAAIGFLTPNYNANQQYISELGAQGALNATLVNWGIFLPTGLFTLIAVLWLVTQLPRSQRMPALLLLGIGLGNIGAALFPCDAGCPAEGSAQQAIHNTIGLVQYLSGGIGLLWISRRGSPPLSLCLGMVVLACLFMMGGPGAEMRGLWQRLAELCLFGWLPFRAWFLSNPKIS